jgi:hypothetical protein
LKRRPEEVTVKRFHHTWIVEVELEITNPGRRDGAESRAQRIFEALAAHASEETDPYPAQVTRDDDCWLEVSFPVWASSQWAAIAAGAAMLSDACAKADAEIGIVRVAAAESSREHLGYKERVRGMEETPASA